MKKEVEWLYSQLPEWVEKGLLSPESAEHIRQYYGTANQGRKSWVTVFGVIGAVLIGLGIILILAHNWQQLTRADRMFVAMGLLVLAQLTGLVVLWTRTDSRTWTEGAAGFLFLMVGASMALIGQTYHLADDTSRFLLAWMLLSLPLIYLFRSALAAILYFVGITAWVLQGTVPVVGKHLIWLLLAAVLPYWRSLLADPARLNQMVLVTWFMTLSLFIAFGSAFQHQIGQLGLLLFVALFTLTYLIGVLWLDQSGAAWRRPLVAIGLSGTTGLSFILTFRSVWLGIERSTLQMGEAWLAFALLIPVIMLAVLLLKRQGKSQAAYSGAPLAVGAAYLLQLIDPSGFSAAALMNGFVLLFGIAVLMRGVKEDSLGLLNLGMLIIAALIMARFVDSNFSFIVRGLVFMALGASFLLVNWMASRRKAGKQDE